MTEVGSGDETGNLVPHGQLLLRDVPQSEFPVWRSAQKVTIILGKNQQNLYAIDNIKMRKFKERQVEEREKGNL